MRVLVTAGSTEVPIDRVRSIGNVFKGKTGAAIAKYFGFRNPDVTLLTSAEREIDGTNLFEFLKYRTFDDLLEIMEHEITTGGYDVIVHSAAVSDYSVSRVLIPSDAGDLEPIDKEGKVSSSHKRLYLELTPTIKLVDQIREPWGFKGKLVKFKLQVGISDEELITIAKKSMDASRADFIVANCLEWCRERAYIIGPDLCESISRQELPAALYGKLE